MSKPGKIAYNTIMKWNLIRASLIEFKKGSHNACDKNTDTCWQKKQNVAGSSL